MVRKQKKIHSSQLLPKFEDQFKIGFLKNFKIVPSVLSLRRQLGQGRNLIILLGSSGVGRDTVLETCLSLIKNSERIERITTRLPRKKKSDQERMFFVNKNVFLRNFKKGEIVFGGRYRVNNQLYGVSRSELLKLKDKDKLYFFECTITALPLKKLFPQSKLIFLLPSSLQLLRRRFLQRGDKDRRKRFAVACSEIKVALNNIQELIDAGFVDLAFINFDSKKTAQKIVKVLKSTLSTHRLKGEFLRKIKKYAIK